eukprot:13242190-Alexandrium_andersonii.AAC.1
MGARPRVRARGLPPRGLLLGSCPFLGQFRSCDWEGRRRPACARLARRGLEAGQRLVGPFRGRVAQLLCELWRGARSGPGAGRRAFL